MSKTNEVLHSDKPTIVLEESISNTNTPTNNKKDMCSRQQLVGDKDKKLSIKGNLEKISDMDNKNLNGGYFKH